jgi:hypothetical protein
MPTIEQKAALDPIIEGLVKRLREIKATEEVLSYVVSKVYEVLPPRKCRCCTKSKCPIEFTIKDAEKMESFKALEERYRREYLTPYYTPTVVDSPISEDCNDS